jgi:hypothetical protein
MIKHALMEIGGVGLYGVISILLFFTVFSSALVWALCLRRPFLRSMGQLPLADGEIETVTLPTRKEACHE